MRVNVHQAPKGENPRDSKLLKQLRRAREREHESQEEELIGELITGWRPKVEEQQRFWGLSEADGPEVTSAWMERMTKVLMKKTDFNGPFGAVALENAHWARKDFIRKRERRRETVLDHRADEAVFDDAVDDDLDVDGFPSATLVRALEDLSERDRRILDGFFGEDRAGADVAAELGMTPGAFRVAQSRALGKVRERLEAEGVTRADLCCGNRP
jgi:RNA polymerase sigma factor (sigma-70 family)